MLVTLLLDCDGASAIGYSAGANAGVDTTGIVTPNTADVPPLLTIMLYVETNKINEIEKQTSDKLYRFCAFMDANASVVGVALESGGVGVGVCDSVRDSDSSCDSSGDGSGGFTLSDPVDENSAVFFSEEFLGFALCLLLFLLTMTLGSARCRMENNLPVSRLGVEKAQVNKQHVTTLDHWLW